MSTVLEVDVSVTGFYIPQIDSLLETVAPEDAGDPDDDIVPELAPARVQPGNIWQLGRHRLTCGDARGADVVSSLMNGEAARMVFSDPPYNVPIDGPVGNSGKIRHREFAMASGEMSQSESTTFLVTAFRNLADHSTDGSIHYICMDWRHMSEMLEAGQAVYEELKNLIVWAEDNGGMGTFYRSRHELVFVFKKGRAPHINAFELGQHGRYRTNVWEYRWVNSRHAGRMEELTLHPTVKPVQMIADAIRDVSGRGGIVLDKAYREITVRDGDRNVAVPMAQAVIRAMSLKAAKGDHRSQRLFAELLASTESANRMLHNRWVEGATEYKVEWERELRRREALGLTDLPVPLPHPDHVIIDYRSGTARIMGPMTEAEKVERDDLVRTKKVLEDGIADLTQILKTEEDEVERADIELGQESLDTITMAVPD